MILALLLSIHFSSAELVTSGDSQELPTDCQTIQPGFGVYVENTDATSPTGIERAYRVFRDKKSPNKYTAEFNLTFEPNDRALEELFANARLSVQEKLENAKAGGDRAVRSSEMQARMRAHVNECFRKTNPLKSPDGTELDLRLNVATDNEKAKPFKIAISETTHRSNSVNWESDIDCPTVVHEVLHVAGLCDGYHEQTGLDWASNTVGMYLSWDKRLNSDKEFSWAATEKNCRSIEPKDSLMNAQAVRLATTYEFLYCGDEKSETGSLEKHSVAVIPPRCKSGSKLHMPFVDMDTIDQWMKENPSMPGKLYLKENPEKPNTQLYNGQMRMIVKPNCPKENHLYITCAQNAYRTSSKEGCAKVPEKCRTLTGEHLR